MTTLSGLSRDQGQFYDIVTPATDLGPLPVDLATIKECLKLPSGPGPEDDYLTLLLNASTLAIENYMGRREIRANTWTVLQDCFASRIPLLRDPVASVTSVERVVATVLTAVTASDYVLKQSQQYSEILIAPDASWPTDQDDGEHQIKIVFVTTAHRFTDMARAAIKRHVAFMYENRGDCDPAGSSDSLKASGALGLLASARIQKV